MDDQKEQIIDVLSKERISATISAIASKTGIDRHAVARHLEILEIYGKVRKIQKGSAKKYQLVIPTLNTGFIDISSDLILIIDSNMIIQHINTAATNYIKMPYHEIIKKRLDKINLPVFSTPELINKILIFNFETKIKYEYRPNSETWFEISIFGISLVTSQTLIAIIVTDISDQKRKEEELRVAREKFLLAFQASPDAIIILDAVTGEFLEVNKASCQILNYTIEELVGKTIEDLNITTNKTLEEFVELSLNGKKDKPFFTPLTKKSEEIFIASITASKIVIGKRDCLMLIIRDITKLRENEERIRISEEHYHLLADNTYDVIWILDITTGYFTYVSPSVYYLRGYTPEEVLNQTSQEVMTEESFQRIQTLIVQIMNDYRKGIRFPKLITRIDQYHRDGSIVPTEVIARFLKGSDGKIDRVLGVSRDISERLALEEKLKKNVEYYRHLAESISDVIWILDPKTLFFKYISPSVETLTGFKPEVIITRHLNKIIAPEIYSNLEKILWERYETFILTKPRNMEFKDKIKLITSDNRTVLCDVVSNYVINNDTEKPEVIGIARNANNKYEYRKTIS
jgi:PAS domain S-box-containing protein